MKTTIIKQGGGGMKTFLIVLIVILVLIVGFFGWKKISNRNSPQSQNQSRNASHWQEIGAAISGQYADADVVDIGGGKYRMYYSAEPEASKNLEVYSATSADGTNWTKEEGIRKTMAVFPDVIKLPDGKWRMYFQNEMVIKSAISDDGLTFKDEPGVRIDKNESTEEPPSEAGLNLSSVGAQSTTQLENGDYIMVYRGTINEPYQTQEKIPNSDTQLYFRATSKDGLNFTKQGIAIDSRNDTLYGLADGADWVNWDDGNLRVYFWSYKGVYHLVLENASTNNPKFSAPVFDFTNKTDSNAKFLPDPPSDPTLLNINGKWYMYYGQHGKGIYYATLK